MGASRPDQDEREKLYRPPRENRKTAAGDQRNPFPATAHWIGTNFSLGAPQTGQNSGGSSPTWMYPQTVHFHFFIGRSPPGAISRPYITNRPSL